MEKMPYAKDSESSLQHQSGPPGYFEKEYSDLIDLAVHDLDAPLRKLTLLVGMLTNKLAADKDTQSYIERIENCVGDMRSLVDDLSILGKISSHEMEPTLCNMDTIIQQALQDLPATIKEKKAVITALSLPEIEGDQRQFRSLFKNLLENAIKFNKKDTSPEIHIQSSVLTSKEKNDLSLGSERLYYKIEINDNGIGFKSEHAEKIFQPFVRLHGKSQFSGNGIGLAICKKIMDIHHGIIYAEGRENLGSRFVLILPESR
jgi:hypothetical protein